MRLQNLEYLPYCYRETPVVHRNLPCTVKAHSGLKLHFKIPVRGKTIRSNFAWESFSTYVTLFVKVPVWRKPIASNRHELLLAIHLWQLSQQNPCNMLNHRTRTLIF